MKLKQVSRTTRQPHGQGTPDGKGPVTPEELTTLLAKRVMRWDVGPDRFLMSNRKWMPRWRFQPTEKLNDAFRLLEAAAPQEYSLIGDDEGNFQVRVRIGGVTGQACGRSKPLTITCAIARALGMEVEQ